MALSWHREGTFKGGKMKQTQVRGERYTLPEGEIEVEKAIRRALALEKKYQEAKAALDEAKAELTEIATARRDGETTIRLDGISGRAVVTYRESLEPDAETDRIKPALGALWERFFEFRPAYKAKKDLKPFMDGAAAMGMDPTEAAALREKIADHVKRKAIKPNVKLTPAE
jgi:hypothetical protein